MLPVTQIDTFYNGLTLRHRDTINAVAGGTFMKRRLEECYDLIENMTAHHNDWDTSAQWTTVGNTQNVYAARAYQDCMIRSSVTKLMTKEKIFQIFKDLNFNISFADALILMPKFGPTIKTLLTKKDKLSELARTPLIEHCLAVLLKKLSAKPEDPGKFFIPRDFPEMAECLTLTDLGASINLIQLSIWNKLSFPDFSPACMTLKLANHFDADPRVPLILRRSFLKTRRALIDVFEGEVTLRVCKETITFNLDQTSRYSANYNDMTRNRIDVIDMACEEHSQEYSVSLIDFLLEEVDAFLALEDDPTSLEVDQSYVDTEGDILLLEAFLNNDPSLPPQNQGNYLPQVRKELKICEAKTDKSSIDEPPEVELKDLPPHLEYAFLEGDDKLPVIIAKDLSVEEKTALITEDFKLAVQHQRRVNPKIHDVIKNEVLKLLDAGLIYLISDGPWVSPVHCVPKKGGFTVTENEENELILTRLVTGWRMCIDYRKLNEGTRKDHFPLPFMDQMLERLAGNEYYYFLDGFSGYFPILIDPKDQEKTTFTCPYRTFAYCRMPFGLCNAPGTFQRFMMAIFHDMIEKTMEVFMDDFSVFGNSFQTYLSHLEKMLKRCEDTNLCLNWEKSHFMVKEGTYFCNDQFAKVMLKFDVTHGLATPYYPQTSGQVEAFHLPIELEHKAYWALKHENFHLQTAGDHKKVQLNELRDQAYENSLIYKEKTKRLYDSKIKDRVFNIGDRVLLFNSRLKIFSGKLKSCWSGPFTISHVFPYGTFELSQPDGPNFKVNGHRLKHYFGEDIPKVVVPDL
nr:reverse transcriptase domain-containing protein [Tanacetum cinerariifolium]